MPPKKKGGRQNSKAARRQAAHKERLRAESDASSSQGEPALAIGVTGGFAGTDEESHTPAAISAAFATAATFVRRAIQGGQSLATQTNCVFAGENTPVAACPPLSLWLCAWLCAGRFLSCSGLVCSVLRCVCLPCDCAYSCAYSLE